VRIPALVMLGMYLVGIVTALPVAWLLRRTALAGPPPSFLLELPSYKWPRPALIWQRVHLSARSFLVRAGTIILLVNLLVWALAYFPRLPATRARVAQARAAAGWDQPRFQAELAAAHLRASALGRMGHALEPALAPLGWDWRIGVSVIASFPAREVVIATLGTLFNLEQGRDADEPSLRQAIQAATWDGSDRRLFTLPVGLSLMVFFALCAQCASTLVMIGRETRSLTWPVVSFVGMTTLAYLAAWGTAAAARALGL
jgi:ferrous iron transport protein B